MLVAELQPDSPKLLDLNNRFGQMAQDIDILTCYETKETKTVVKLVRD